ncbi:hypothetical protein EMMF5_003192 [Cystobasidiomycetes sp. EMM_F5]
MEVSTALRVDEFDGLKGEMVQVQNASKRGRGSDEKSSDGFYRLVAAYGCFDEDARSRSRIPRFGFGTKSGAVTTRNGGPEHGAHTEVRFETHILQEMTHNPDLPKAKPLINGDEDLHNNEKPFDGNPYATHAY